MCFMVIYWPNNIGIVTAMFCLFFWIFFSVSILMMFDEISRFFLSELSLNFTSKLGRGGEVFQAHFLSL